MDKLTKQDGATTDIVGQNIERLKEIFPDVFTEGKVDFEALQEVLGHHVEDRPERYSFTWNGKSHARRIAEVMHRAIPYPLVIVFVYGTTCALSLVHKRFSQAEKGAIVAEDFIITDWFDLSAPTPVQNAFLISLAVSALPHTQFFAFYSALVDRLVALDCARLTSE